MAVNGSPANSAPLSSSNASTTTGTPSRVASRSRSYRYHRRRPSPDLPIARTASVGKRCCRRAGAMLARASRTGPASAPLPAAGVVGNGCRSLSSRPAGFWDWLWAESGSAPPHAPSSMAVASTPTSGPWGKSRRIRARTPPTDGWPREVMATRLGASLGLRVRQGEGDQARTPADREGDVLPAVDHVGHRSPDRSGREVDRGQLFTRCFVVGDQARPPG